MSSKGGYAKHTRNKGGTEDGYGPSWYECSLLLEEMEHEFGCRIHFLIDPANAGRRWKAPEIWVRARAYHFGVEGISDQWGSCQFKGNNGAGTMAGAWYGALLSLYETLHDMPAPTKQEAESAGEYPWSN